MRPLLPALALSLALVPSSALAGGIGLVTTVGGHGDRVYSQTADATGEYHENDPENQINPNYGVGFEVVLGDKDDKLSGVFRGYLLQDSPQQEPQDGEVKEWRTDPRNIGVVTAGLQWGIVGDPTGLQLTAVANAGAGLFTTDLTEYLTGEAGVGATWTIQRHVQLAGTITGGARYRKRFYPTTNAYVGVRYLFD
jgi:hypothetical protein